LKSTVEALKKCTDDADYKVFRAHHPPFNVEGGFQELTSFWSVKLDDLGYAGKTLLDFIVAAKIKIFLVSHHHSGQIMAYPVKSLGDLAAINLKSKEDDADVKKVSKKMTGSETYFKGECVHRDPSKVAGSNFDDSKDFVSVQTCSDTTLSYNLKDNFKDMTGGYMWFLVAGNSGRGLDPVEDHVKTRGSLLFGRAKKGVFGGINIIFKKKVVQADFYEVAAGSSAFISASLILTQDTTAVAYPHIDKHVAYKKAPARRRQKKRMTRRQLKKMQRKMKK